MKTRYWFTGLVLVSFMLLFQACSDDDPLSPANDDDVLLIVEFENYTSLNEPRTGLVFVSDENGHLLDMAPFSSDSRVVLRSEEPKPDYVSMTLFDLPPLFPRLTTEFAIPVGSTMGVPERPKPKTTGSVTLQFRHESQFSSLSVSALNSVHIYSGHVPYRESYYVSGETMDMYMKAVPETGVPIGAWLHDVRAGDRDTMDLESPIDFFPLNSHRIGVPQGSARTSCNIYQKVEMDQYSGQLALDFAAMDPESGDAVIAYLPTMDHSDFSIQLNQWYDGSPETTYRTMIQGSLPESISIWDGALEVVSSQADSIVIEADFSWSQFNSRWRQDKEGSPYWFVKGPFSSEGWGLPELPEEVAEAIPEYPRNGFLLSYLEVQAEAVGEVSYYMGKSFSIGGKNWQEEEWNADTSFVKELR